MLKTKVENYDDKHLVFSNGLESKGKSRFTLLHTSVLYDKQLENIRKAFQDKYSIDYLTIIGMYFDTNHNLCWFGNIPHENWRDCIILHSFYLSDSVLVKTAELPKGKGRLMFPDIEGYKGFNVRGEIIGEYKNPFDICMHSNISDIRWGFSITLKGLASILSVDYKTYVQLRRDLQKIEPFLMPFYDYFKEFRSITDTPELKQRLKDHNFNFVI